MSSVGDWPNVNGSVSHMAFWATPKSNQNSSASWWKVSNWWHVISVQNWSASQIWKVMKPYRSLLSWRISRISVTNPKFHIDLKWISCPFVLSGTSHGVRALAFYILLHFHGSNTIHWNPLLELDGCIAIQILVNFILVQSKSGMILRIAEKNIWRYSWGNSPAIQLLPPGQGCLQKPGSITMSTANDRSCPLDVEKVRGFGL